MVFCSKHKGTDETYALVTEKEMRCYFVLHLLVDVALSKTRDKMTDWMDT